MMDRSFSLTLALRSVVKEGGLEVDVDDLHAALGLSMMACAVPAESDPGNWSMYARDAFLVPAGWLFGLTIRDLHPPEAAHGLNAAVEFRQHFDASYRPFIIRALENDQPVLAWQGWPGEHRLMWGVIKDLCADGVGVRGMLFTEAASRTRAHPETLVCPPVQVYVVETPQPARPNGGELLKMTLDHVRRILRGELKSRFGVLTGVEAYELWSAALKTQAAEAERFQWPDAHQQLAASIRTAHESAIRFLERQNARLQEDRHSVVPPMIALCRQIVEALSAATMENLARARTATMELLAGLEHV